MVGPLGDGGNYDTVTNLFDYPQMPLSSIYEGLMAYPSGQSRWAARNLLARSIEKSPDGLAYRFVLRAGVQFHRGFGELTAEDVKYSFERAAGLVPLYPGAAKDNTSFYAADFSDLTGVTVTGRYSGEIRFRKPFVPFETITLPFASSGWIVSRKAIEKYGASASQNPVGTGPYELVSYSPNSHMKLRRFAHYHGGNQELGAHNAFDEIDLVLAPNSARSSGQALTVPIESGEVDFADTLGALDVQLLADDPRFTAYRPKQALNSYFLAIDAQHPVLRDIRVRQAIRCAVDIEEINLANRVPPSSRLKAAVARELDVGYWPEAPSYERDVGKARRLLAQAGVRDLSLPIATPNISITTGDPNAVMQVIQSNLKDVGIAVEIIATAPDSFVSQPGAAGLLWGNFAGAPDPYFQLEWFTHDQLGVWNYASWSEPEYDHLHDQLGTTTDPRQRKEIAVRMQRLMDSGSAYVFASQAVNFGLSKSGVRAVFDGNGNPQLHYFYRVAS
ncbi:ABC transporter substrate-binding protein [Sciscionella marina]|uniref:ABC transporter substrate-binding protein n=1 Tax=Sciscionella marina TaxID=508770 RepID=UPI000371BB13|nr:ABC transporter substrate-binding protein [Sciscionella marina]